MKISKTPVFVLCLFILGTSKILAQQASTKVDIKEIYIQKHTMMEQFAPDLVVPVNQRLVMKNQRASEIKRKLAILDTLDISDRKKRKLLSDLKYSPFSNRLDRATLVNTEFQDATDNDNK